MVMQIEELIKCGILSQSEAADIRRESGPSQRPGLRQAIGSEACALVHRATQRDRMKLLPPEIVMPSGWIVFYLKNTVPRMVKIKHNRAAMAASSFLQSRELLCLRGGLRRPRSAREESAVHVQYLGKRMLKRKVTWKVHMIVRMESHMFDTDGILAGGERAVVAYCLL